MPEPTSLLTEDEVFERLIYNPDNEHRMIIVRGNHGTGKSHLIRFLKGKFERSPFILPEICKPNFFLCESLIVLFQFFLTDFPNFCFFFLTQPLPHGFIHLDDTQSLGVAEHLHILEAFKWLG